MGISEGLGELQRCVRPLTPNPSPALGGGEPKSIDVCDSMKSVVTIFCKLNSTSLLHCFHNLCRQFFGIFRNHELREDVSQRR